MIQQMAKPQQQPSERVDSVAIARELVLERSGLNLSSSDRAIASAMSRDLDYADLYFQMSRLRDLDRRGRHRQGGRATASIRASACARYPGRGPGFAYADQLDEPSLLDAVAPRAASRARKAAAT